MRGAWFLVLISICCTGCVRTAVVRSWEPAAIDVASMNRLVVLEFAGEHGSSIATTLSGQLWQNEFYHVVERSELSHDLQLAGYSKAASSSDEKLHEILSCARASQIDGVLLGEVLEYQCADKHVRRTSMNASSGGSTIGSGRMMGGNGVGIDFRETLVREGTVTVAFRLVDVQTGEIRAAKQVSQHYSGENELGPARLPSQTEVLEDLTQKCVDEIVEMLAPHQVNSEIQLAACDIWTKGRRAVIDGNLQAQKGNWEAAERHWQSALEIEPRNHAAMFNLSIAADHRHDYAVAEELAMEALRHQHKSCYAVGLDKIRSHRAAAEKAAEQRDARVATLIEEQWR